VIFQNGQSILQRLGLPSEFGITILALTLTLSLAPYLSGADFGLLKIPPLALSIRRRLRVVGPCVLALAIVLHLPLLGSKLRPPKTATPTNVSRIARPSQESSTTTSMSPVDNGPANANRRPTISRNVNSYKVTLIFATSLRNVTVLVDGLLPTILRRTASTVTIEIPRNPARLHEFRLQADGRPSCVVTTSVGRDMTIVPCEN
jgi:hypothetical protein